jgi:hypothetical protein
MSTCTPNLLWLPWNNGAKIQVWASKGWSVCPLYLGHMKSNSLEFFTRAFQHSFRTCVHFSASGLPCISLSNLLGKGQDLPGQGTGWDESLRFGIITICQFVLIPSHSICLGEKFFSGLKIRKKFSFFQTAGGFSLKRTIKCHFLESIPYPFNWVISLSLSLFLSLILSQDLLFLKWWPLFIEHLLCICSDLMFYNNAQGRYYWCLIYRAGSRASERINNLPTTHKWQSWNLSPDLMASRSCTITLNRVLTMCHAPCQELHVHYLN